MICEIRLCSPDSYSPSAAELHSLLHFYFFLFFYFPSLSFFFFFVIFCLVQFHCCYFFGPFVSIGNMKRAQTIQISPASSSKSNKSEHIYCNHKYNWSERNTYYRKYELKFVGRQKEVMLTDCYA